MSLKPQPPRPIPKVTATLLACRFEDGSVYQFIGDVLFDQFRDDDLANLYPKDDQPARSPRAA